MAVKLHGSLFLAFVLSLSNRTGHCVSQTPLQRQLSKNLNDCFTTLCGAEMWAKLWGLVACLKKFNSARRVMFLVCDVVSAIQHSLSYHCKFSIAISSGMLVGEEFGILCTVLIDIFQ